MIADTEPYVVEVVSKSLNSSLLETMIACDVRRINAINNVVVVQFVGGGLENELINLKKGGVFLMCGVRSPSIKQYMEGMGIEIIIADYLDVRHQEEIPMLLNLYATDPMGGGVPLVENVREKLVSELAKIEHAFSVIAYVGGEAAGLVNCFGGFSTFRCKPIVNIHDVVVLGEFRGHGLSQKMLDKVEEVARGRGCCKITLEVLSKNEVAKAAYEKFGFAGYELDPKDGVALFWEKPLG